MRMWLFVVVLLVTGSLTIFLHTSISFPSTVVLKASTLFPSGHSSLPGPIRAQAIPPPKSATEEDRSDYPDFSPIVIDRLTLQGLEQYEIELEKQQGYTAPLTGWINPNSPPAVTALPGDSRKPQPRPSAPMSTNSDGPVYKDFTHIPSLRMGFPRKFILPGRIVESEMKAQSHLIQISALARALNRTLVLPNVNKGRMGTCYGRRFGFYYNLDATPSPSPNDDENFFQWHAALGYVIGFDDFQKWAKKSELKLSAQVVVIEQKPDTSAETTSSNSAVSETNDPTLYLDPTSPEFKKAGYCLLRRLSGVLYFALSTPNTVTICPTKLRWWTDQVFSPGAVTRFGDALVSWFSSQELMENSPDVWITEYKPQHPLFPDAPRTPLQYATSWLNLATSVTEWFTSRDEGRMDSLAMNSEGVMTAAKNELVTVHWRMETIDSSVLVDCARDLVKFLQQIPAHPALVDRYTFLASDYPMEAPSNAQAHSGSFLNLDEQHHQAIAVLRDGVKKIGQSPYSRILWSLPQAVKAMNVSETVSEALETDSGLLAIVDKNIAMRATWFVSGGKMCAKTSSFTKHIIEERQKASGLMNVVGYFGPD